MNRLRVETSTLLAVIALYGLVRIGAHWIIAELVPLPAWRPLAELVIGVPAICTGLALVVLPVRRAALASREERP